MRAQTAIAATVALLLTACSVSQADFARQTAALARPGDATDAALARFAQAGFHCGRNFLNRPGDRACDRTVSRGLVGCNEVVILDLDTQKGALAGVEPLSPACTGL